ncbi:MAG: class I SAM-dependent methyltransferase [Clostridia bacterium]
MINYNSEWKDYRVIASGDGYKLEDFGGVVLLRPDPQIIWRSPFPLREYPDLNAVYERGDWTVLKPVPEEFYVSWRSLKFALKLMKFKHTGVFPEQATNWDRIIRLIGEAGRQANVLNLFAYTGGATLAAAAAGAKVCHVDSARAMCERAGKNAALSNLKDAPIRYIIEDCEKFVEREIRRGKTYDGIIMDPPSFGRGTKGEMWKLEDKINNFVHLTRKLLSPSPLFYLVNSYTAGLQPTVMRNILNLAFYDIPHQSTAYEIGLPTNTQGVILPSGTSALITF